MPLNKIYFIIIVTASNSISFLLSFIQHLSMDGSTEITEAPLSLVGWG